MSVFVYFCCSGLLPFPMTRLSEEAVLLCFQLTLCRVAELWSARRGRLLARLSAAVASARPCMLFKHSDIPFLFPRDNLVEVAKCGILLRRVLRSPAESRRRPLAHAQDELSGDTLYLLLI